LVDAGLSLFLDRGIEAVTIDEVAREAGMAKGNFYRYFRDKADLVDAVIEPVAQATREAIQQCVRSLRRANGRADAVEAYRALGDSLVGALTLYPDALCLYLQERRAPPTEARHAVSNLANDLDEGVVLLSEIAVDRDLLTVSDPRLSALAFLGAVEALALAWARKQVQLDPVETSKNLVSVVLAGLRS
jgi:AcrR family transcriptional regulator